MFCPYCRLKYEEKLAQCSGCGRSLDEIGKESSVVCSTCKKDNPVDALYCWSCEFRPAIKC